MKNFKRFFLVLLLIGLFPLVVSAGLPIMYFAGTVEIDGKNVPSGTEIKAYSVETGERVDQGFSSNVDDNSRYGYAGTGNPVEPFSIVSGPTIQFRAIIDGYQSTNPNNELIANENANFVAGTWGDNDGERHFNLTFSTPTASVTGAPENWRNTDATAGANCNEEGGSGCKADSYKVKVYDSKPVSCSTNRDDYTLPAGTPITGHSWVCSYVEDKNGHIDFSDTPTEFKVDKSAPIISNNYAAFDGVLVHTNQTITLLPEDTGGSGIKTVKYCTGAGCEPNTVYSYPLTYTTSQDTVVRYQVSDNAGNLSAIESFTLKIRKYDINEGGKVDLADFSVMMSVWGKASSYSDNALKSDLNANSVVDLADFSILMANWGKTN